MSPSLDQIIATFQQAVADLQAFEAAQGAGGGSGGGTGGGTTGGGTAGGGSAGGGSTTGGGTSSGAPPFFTAADWLWKPIPANPRLDPNSAAWASMLGGSNHVADTSEYGVEMADVTASTSVQRQSVPLATGWGAKSIANVPVPPGLKVASGGDKGLAIIDHAGGMVYSFWVAQVSGQTLRAQAGSALPIDGDGRETGGFTSTGSCLARAAAVLRLSEVAAGEVPHALFFASQFVQKSVFRYPATKTDGSNMRGASNPIPEGARVQLDPSIDLSKIAGITPFELAVGRALQVYGAYCGDNGGAGMAFSCELGDYSHFNGGAGDYFGMPHLPWSRLRVLAQWDGA